MRLKMFLFLVGTLSISSCNYEPDPLCTNTDKIIRNKGQIEAYSNAISYLQGDSVTFYSHTYDSVHRIITRRYGQDVEIYNRGEWIPGKVQDYTACAYQNGANWESTYKMRIEEDWPPGLYSTSFQDHSTKTAFATFIVKNKDTVDTERILVLASTNTWQAYNSWGGASQYIYDESTNEYVTQPAQIVSFHRPNRMAHPIGNDGHLVNAELHLIGWLERNGYSYDIAADIDLHEDDRLLNRYHLVIINVHSEYWSSDMLVNLKAYLNQGGSLAYLGGNGIYWRVTLQDNQIEVQKDEHRHHHAGRKGGNWRELGQPESSILGVEFSREGYNTFYPYRVLLPEHWAFAGTNLKKGDMIGEEGLNPTCPFSRSNPGQLWDWIFSGTLHIFLLPFGFGCSQWLDRFAVPR